MHQDLIRAKTGLPLDFEWVGARNNVLNPQLGAVRLMIASIGLLAQPESMRPTIGATHQKQPSGLSKWGVFCHSNTLDITRRSKPN